MPAPRRRIGAVAIIGALALPSSSARADSAAAEKLFKEGTELLAKSKVAEACAKFEASEKEQDAIGTVEALGNCHEQAGDFPRAYQEFADVAARAGANFDAKKADAANARKKALEGKLGKLFLALPAGANVDVSLDGTTLMRDRLGAELLVTAGDHVLRSTIHPGGSPPQAIEGTVHVPANLGVLTVTVPTKPGDAFAASDGPPKPVAPQQIIVTTPGRPTPPPPVDDSPAAGWIVLGVVGVLGGVLMTSVAIGLFVEASDETGSANTEHTAGGVALIILGPLCLAGGIGGIYYGVHPSKMPAVDMNPFAQIPDLVVGPRYAGVRWHF
jgi:hypothetical protein